MSALSVTYAILFYLATAVLVSGLIYKIRQYATTPAPLKIATTPAPVTQTGVVFRMAREVVLFASLFKSNKWIWLFGWMFHVALLLIVLRHFRYFVDNSSIIWFWVPLIQPFGKYAAFAMLAGLGGLWARRILVDRVRYISSPSDHLMLALLIGIGASGVTMKFITHTDIVQVKAFFTGLLSFNIHTLPNDTALLIHLALVITLMLIFPISKLLHAPVIFFSPTRNQIDNPREKRHLAPWAAKLEAQSDK